MRPREMSLGKKLLFGFGGLLVLMIMVASSSSSHTANLGPTALTPSPAPNMEAGVSPAPSAMQHTPIALPPAATLAPTKSVAAAPTTTPVAAPVHTYTNVDGSNIESPDSNTA